jgi:Cu+-exporting ATPase
MHPDRSHPATPDPSHASGVDGRVIDPVCGMTVDLATARPAALTVVHEGTEYGFCGRGCRLDFGDDPQRYLSPDHVPSM